MSYVAHCIGCRKDTDWIDGKCLDCGSGPYTAVPEQEIITLREQRDKLLGIISVLVYKWDQYMERDVKIRNRDFIDARAALKEVEEPVG